MGAAQSISDPEDAIVKKIQDFVKDKTGLAPSKEQIVGPVKNNGHYQKIKGAVEDMAKDKDAVALGQDLFSFFPLLQAESDICGGKANITEGDIKAARDKAYDLLTSQLKMILNMEHTMGSISEEHKGKIESGIDNADGLLKMANDAFCKGERKNSPGCTVIQDKLDPFWQRSARYRAMDCAASLFGGARGGFPQMQINITDTKDSFCDHGMGPKCNANVYLDQLHHRHRRKHRHGIK